MADDEWWGEMRQELVDRVDDDGVAERAVRDALAPLKLLGAGLYDDAVGYVLMGAGPEVLARVRAARTQETEQLFRWPGRCSGGWPPEDAVRQVAAVHEGWDFEPGGITARGHVYAAADIATVVRLGRLLAEIGEAEKIPGVPEWFYVLVFDGAMLAVPRSRPARSTDVPDVEPVAGVVDRMTPRFLEQAVIEGGVADGDVVRAVLVTLLYWPAYEPSWHRWLHPREILGGRPPFTEYFSRHVSTLAAVTEELSTTGRLRLLRCIGPHATDAGLGEIVATLAVDTSKGVRTSALDHLAVLDEAIQGRLLTPQLTAVPVGRIGEAVTRLAGLDSGIGLLNDVLASIRDGKAAGRHRARAQFLEQAVEQARALRGPVAQATAETADTAAGIPGYEPLPDAVVDPGWAESARRHLDQEIAETKGRFDLAAKELGEHSTVYRVADPRRTLERLRSFTDEDLAAIPGFATGTAPITDEARGQYAAVARWVFENLRALFPAPGPMLAIRIFALQDADAQHIDLRDLQPFLTGVTDLRQVHDAMVGSGIPNADEQICNLVYQFPQWHPDALSPSVILPYFAERPEALDPYLSRVKTWGFGVAGVLQLLKELPAVPPALLSRLAALGLGTSKTYRRDAQKVLEHHAAARPLAENALADAKAEVRVLAAVWLGRIGDPRSVPALRAALAKERKEAVQAALLSALETLGDDISADLAPQVLQTEATKGLKSKMPAWLEWFPFDQLPEVRWESSGAVVPRDIIRWWVILAAKLRSPSGEGLIARYTGLLDADSRAALGSFVLNAWVDQDTRHPSVESSRAYADQNEAARAADVRRNRQLIYQKYRIEAALSTMEQAVKNVWLRLYQEHQATYVGSAKQEKGLLALTAGMPGVELARAARAYFAEHKTRRAQAEYLVRALAANGDREAVQQVLAVSRRFKHASVRGTAHELVQDIADRNGWDMDTFADRTVQTAGFDDDGILRLDLGAPDGDQVVIGHVTDALGLQLRDPEGTIVKALPARRASDSEEVYEEAKLQLRETRSELRDVATKQKKRLVDAMVTERSWTFADWREAIVLHPLMLRFGARLVWLARLPGGEGSSVTFRPGIDGSLLRADDTDVALPDDAQVSLVHAAALGDGDGAAAAAAWRAHLTTHKVRPLFDQGLGAASTALPDVSEDATAIEDRRGWFSDWFTIRDRAKKLGYTRSDAWPDEKFFAYGKEYRALGITVEIEFTGAYVPPLPFMPDENTPAAVTQLVFFRTRDRSSLAVKDIPKAMLAVSYQEYLTVAGGGAFDPDWADKSAL